MYFQWLIQTCRGIPGHLIQIAISSTGPIGSYSKKSTIIHNNTHASALTYKVSSSEKVQKDNLSPIKMEQNSSDRALSWKSLRSAKLKQSSGSSQSKKFSESLTKDPLPLPEMSKSKESLESPASIQSIKSLTSLSVESNQRLPATIQLTPVNSSDPLCLKCLNDSDIPFYNYCAGRK